MVKQKARLVAHSFIQQPVDCEEVTALVTRMESVWLLLAMDTKEGWPIHHMDIKFVSSIGIYMRRCPCCARIHRCWRRMEGAAAAQSTLQAASSTEVLLSHYSIERIWGNIEKIFYNQLKGFFFVGGGTDSSVVVIPPLYPWEE